MESPLDQASWHRGLEYIAPKCPPSNVQYISDLIRRSGSSVPIPNIQTIVGIAVAGFAILFCTLVALGCYCAQVRYSPTKRRSIRAADLDNRNVDVFEALQLNPPPAAITLGRERSFPYFSSRASWTRKRSKDGTNDVKNALNTESRSPSSKFRDSTPLSSWPILKPPKAFMQIGESPQQPDQTGYVSPLMTSSQRGLTRQLPMASKSCAAIITDIGPAIRSTHSAKGSVSSRPSLQRNSISDNQLTTILRSTSQRLRDSQRAHISRAVSVMSCASGPPPDMKLPSTPKMERGISWEELTDQDEILNIAESAKSSVLSMFSRNSSLGKSIKRSSGIFDAEPVSDDDSVCERNSAEIVFSAGLTSPSKKGRITKRQNAYTLSQDTTPTRPPKNSRVSYIGFRNRDISNPNGLVNGTKNDPFVSGVPLRKPVPFGPQPQSQRKSTFGSISVDDTNLTSPAPLQLVSGYIQPPIKEAITHMNLDPNPFQWSTKIAMTESPNGADSTKRGHKRSQTVRVSGISRGSICTVDVVQEESENESNISGISDQTQKLPEVQISSLIPVNIQSGSVQPPSIFTFQPFRTTPRTEGSTELRKSVSPVSNSLSLCDYFTNTDFSQTGTTTSPALESIISTKKIRRQARNFSVEIMSSQNNPISLSPPALLSATTTSCLPPPSESITIEESPLIPIMPPLHRNATNTSALSQSSASPPRIISLGAQPATPQSPPRASFDDSINLLRRMDGQLFHYGPIPSPSSITPQSSPLITTLPPLPTELLELNGKSPSPASTSLQINSRRGSLKQYSSRESTKIDLSIPEGKKSLVSIKRMKDANIGTGSDVNENDSGKRDLQESINSSLTMAIGLGLQLTGDGNPHVGKHRKNSLWRAESVRNSAHSSPVPDTLTVPLAPVMPYVQGSHATASSGVPQNTQAKQTEGKLNSATGMRGAEMGIRTEQRATGSQLIWEEKLSRSLELYDEDGFLRTSVGSRNGGTKGKEML